MALYGIADLHLSESVGKPMGRFGDRWTDHRDKLVARWRSLVGEDDTVVIPGDFSWGMGLEEARADFLLLDSLPGKKIIGKGNHDYWWTSVTKMRAALDAWGVGRGGRVDFLYNNAFVAENAVIAGTRGWFLDEKQQTPALPADYDRLMNRELCRLRQTLSAAASLAQGGEPIFVFLHFPPVWGDFVCRPFIDLLREARVAEVYFGHIHGQYTVPASRVLDGVRFTLISADRLDFYPARLN